MAGVSSLSLQQLVEIIDERRFDDYMKSVKTTVQEPEVVKLVDELAINLFQNGEQGQLLEIRQVFSSNQIFSEVVEACSMASLLQPEGLRRKILFQKECKPTGGTGAPAVRNSVMLSPGGTEEIPSGSELPAEVFVQYDRFKEIFNLACKYSFVQAGPSLVLTLRAIHTKVGDENPALKARLEELDRMIRNGVQIMEKIGSPIDHRPDTLLRECDELISRFRLFKPFRG